MVEKEWDISVWGDINIDLMIPGVTEIPAPGEEREVAQMTTVVGGGAALTALGLGRLGLRVLFEGIVGEDVHGQFLRKALCAEGIDVSRLQVRSDCQTGITLSFTGRRNRSFLTMRGGNERLDVTSVDLETVKKARHFHLTGYAGEKNHGPYRKLLQRIRRETDVTVSMDLGFDVTEKWDRSIFELLPYLDVLFMNEKEALSYSKAAGYEEAGSAFAQTCRLVVLKLGTGGAAAFADATCFRQESFPVEAVDTTGAGDSFNAGFLFGFLAGLPVAECLRYGNACGALSVTGWGGNTNFPNREQLLEFISGKETTHEDCSDRRSGGADRAVCERPAETISQAED